MKQFFEQGEETYVEGTKWNNYINKKISSKDNATRYGVLPSSYQLVENIDQCSIRGKGNIGWHDEKSDRGGDWKESMASTDTSMRNYNNNEDVDAKLRKYDSGGVKLKELLMHMLQRIQHEFSQEIGDLEATVHDQLV